MTTAASYLTVIALMLGGRYDTSYVYRMMDVRERERDVKYKFVFGKPDRTPREDGRLILKRILKK